MIKKLKYILVLLPSVLLAYFLYATIGLGIGTSGMSKTVGWAWSIDISLPFIIAILFCFFSYTILLLLKCRPVKVLTVINVVVLVMTAATYFLRDGIWFIATVYGCILIIFLCFANTIVSTYNKARY